MQLAAMMTQSAWEYQATVSVMLSAGIMETVVPTLDPLVQFCVSLQFVTNDEQLCIKYL